MRDFRLLLFLFLASAAELAWSACNTVGRDTCLAQSGVSVNEPATSCDGLSGVKPEISTCFVNNGCCDTWDEMVRQWRQSSALIGCEFGGCGACVVNSYTCTRRLEEAYGTPVQCTQWQMMKDNFAKCFIDNTCCSEWAMAMQGVGGNAALEFCELGDCQSCTVDQTDACLEGLGVRSLSSCSALEPFKANGTLQQCFVAHDCCGTWDSFVSSWKADKGLPDCDLGTCAIPPGAFSTPAVSAASRAAAALLVPVVLAAAVFAGA